MVMLTYIFICVYNWGMSLTQKQNNFIVEYCVDWNATQAAIRAGYSQRTAHSIGAENLTKPLIKAAIDKRVEDLAMGKSERLSLFADIARGIESESSADRMRALENLGKIAGDYIDRKQHEHLTPIPIQYVKENREED